MNEFLKELAELLEKHDAGIEYNDPEWGGKGIGFIIHEDSTCISIDTYIDQNVINNYLKANNGST